MKDGCEVGKAVGWEVGEAVGRELGTGFDVGEAVGCADGTGVGMPVGDPSRQILPTPPQSVRVHVTHGL